jgi:hypothetical protein
MTILQKYLLTKLLEGDFYLVRQPRDKWKVWYKLYNGKANPVRWINPRTCKFLKNYFKEDTRGRITLNLSLVRQAHGKSTIKILYKEKATQ